MSTSPHGQQKTPLPGIQNIIAVSSGKGGVGKSTVAVNLAVTLASRGLRVGLLDTDVYGPNVPLMIGINDQPHVVQNKIVPLEAHGLRVMSMGFLNPGDKPVIFRGPMLHGVVQRFLNDVQWGELDYLIVDMPPGTGDVQLSLAQLVPVQGAVVVTTPQEVAATDVRKAIGMFDTVGVPVLGIVENMSYFVCDKCSERHEIFGAGAGDDLAARFKTEVLGKIPLGTAVRVGGDTGVPIVSSQPSSPQATAFREIADRVVAKIASGDAAPPPLPTISL